jgi:hypothetical protein
LLRMPHEATWRREHSDPNPVPNCQRIPMIEEANISIRRADDAALRRRNALLEHRRPVRLLDAWLSQVETLVERNEPIVPEPLLDQISGFLWKLDPLLYRRLRKGRKREILRVLDVLFEAEEQYLPGMLRTP